MTAAAQPMNAKLLKARQRHSRWFVILLLLPLTLFSAARLDGGLLETLMEWIGFALVVVCVLGRSYCSAFIGGIKNERVVREGPFSMVRNPLYVFSFIGVVGIGLQSGKLTLLALLVASFVVYYRFVVQKEEAYLTEKFGDDYRRYCTETPRWFPKLDRWNEPAEVVVRPYFIRHTMLDATVFFLPWPCFKLLALMQQHGFPHFISLI